VRKKLSVVGMSDVLTGSETSLCPNPPVEIGSLKDLIADASILVGYIKMHTRNGRFLRQRTYVNTWNVIDINLTLEEDKGDTFVMLNCLARR
jgi:hypothetical protein